MNTNKTIIQVLVACCLLIIVASSYAGKHDEKKVHKGSGHHVKNHEVKGSLHKSKQHDHTRQGLFSDSERSSIYNYYRHQNPEQAGGKHHKKEKHKKLPPGLQKKLQRGGELPPGWQAKVSRGEVLDAGLLSHTRPLPGDLSRRLPVLRSGEEMLRIGDKVIRVLEGNGTVLDVIDLADVALR